MTHKDRPKAVNVAESRYGQLRRMKECCRSLTENKINPPGTRSFHLARPFSLSWCPSSLEATLECSGFSSTVSRIQLASERAMFAPLESPMRTMFSGRTLRCLKRAT